MNKKFHQHQHVFSEKLQKKEINIKNEMNDNKKIKSQVNYRKKQQLREMMQQEKVQFFNSESSFGSESNLGASRYFDLTNQIVEETQSIFHTLRKQFMPLVQLTNYDKIDYVANRGRILAQDTIPQHLSYLRKIQAPKESLQTCQECVQRLGKFIKDYNALKDGMMIHKQFYNIYGKGQQNLLLFKKDNNQKNFGYYSGYNQDNNGLLVPDVQSIGQIKSSRAKTSQDYKCTQRHRTTIQSDKQMIQLQEQIVRMKRRESDLRKEFEYLLTTEKLNSQKRVNALLKGLIKKNQNPYSSTHEQNFTNQAIRLGEQIQTILRQKQQQTVKNIELQKRVSQLQRMNDSLKDQLVGYRRIQNSKVDAEEQLNRSFQSEQDESKDSKKLALQLKKLTSQRDILKSQLIKQRDLLQKQRQTKHTDQSKQISRLKGYLQARNKQLQQIRRQLDNTKVEVIQTRQQNKLLSKSITSMKDTSEQMKRNMQNIDASNQYNCDNTSIMDSGKLLAVGNGGYKNKLENTRALQKSIFSTTKPNSFDDYNGEGIEGYPYYELLSKQFKIRFKRACLKPKQLLYKANGLEIGVITEYTPPNVIKVLVHITNSSEIDIKSLKFKAMNPNQNKIECEIQEVHLLQRNQQVKIPVTCTIKNYPIGPLVLAIDYQSDQRHDVRLLLPAHIFKCVTIHPRSEPFYNSKKLIIKVEKKICKDLQTLKQYLHAENQSEIQLKIQHQHSASALYLNLFYEKEQIKIEYEHITGTEKFTEYFIKTFKTLLQKQN